MQHRADLGRTFVFASVPTSEYLDAGSPSGRRDHQGRGDFRLIDVTNPTKRGVLTNTTQVWGVAYDEARRLVYASDMNSGLWILRRTDAAARR